VQNADNHNDVRHVQVSIAIVGLFFSAEWQLCAKCQQDSNSSTIRISLSHSDENGPITRPNGRWSGTARPPLFWCIIKPKPAILVYLDHIKENEGVTIEDTSQWFILHVNIGEASPPFPESTRRLCMSLQFAVTQTETRCRPNGT